MAEIVMRIHAADNADLHSTICEMADTMRPKVSTDHKLMHSSDVDAIDKKARQEGYNSGVRDGRSEARQEESMRNSKNNLLMMLTYDVVMMGIAPGRAPFRFKPQFVTTFERVPRTALAMGGAMHDAAYQNELIGTPNDCVGIYGMNLVTNRPMFVTSVDNWTLCPAEPLDKRAEAV